MTEKIRGLISIYDNISDMGRIRDFFQEYILPQTDSEKGLRIGVKSDDEKDTNPDERTVDDYRAMINEDSMVQGLYSTIVDTILSLNWEIEPAESDTSGEQAQSIEDNFTKPPHLGGITSFRNTLSAMLRGLLYGWMPFEKVLGIVEGRVILQNLAQRDPANYEILLDPQQNFAGLRQLEPKVDIPRENSFIMAFNTGESPNYGQSLFRSAFINYQHKKYLNNYDNIAAEKATINPLLLTTPEDTDEESRNNALNRVKNAKFNAALVLPKSKDGSKYELEALNLGMHPNLPKIEWNNLEMARALKAQFIMIIRTGGTSTGSYGLSKDQSTLFLLTLRAIANELEEAINTGLIPDLIQFNFAGATEYPKFKFATIENADYIEALTNAFSGIRKTKYAVKGINEKAAQFFNYEVDDEEEITDAPVPGVPAPDDDDNSDSNSALDDKKKWSRELTAAEQRVNLVEIQDFLRKTEVSFKDSIKPRHDRLRAEALKQVRGTTFKPKFSSSAKTSFEKLEVELKTGVYDRGSKEALSEIKADSNDLRAEAIKGFESEATKITAKLEADLKEYVDQAIVKSGLSELISREDFERVAIAAVATYFDKNLGALASVATATGFALGREDAFESNATKISRYQWSSVLLLTTDATCSGLDGSVVEKLSDANFTPPIHAGCLCMWVAILVDEVDPPPITGLPEAPGGMRTQPLQPL